MATTSIEAITSTVAAGLSLGRNGATNPVFNVNCSVALAAAGLTVIGRAAAAGVDLNVISSGTDENMVINAKGAGTISLNPTGTGAITLARAVSCSATLAVVGNVAVNTNKFTVTAASGNTLVAGTFDATGAATLASTLDVTGDVAVNTDKFTVAASSGNTLVAGTLTVTSDVAVNTDKFTVTAASGNTLVAGTLDVTGNVAVNTDKFIVTAASGNTLVAGTLDVTGNVAINTDKFTVTATNGNTLVGGTLAVTSTSTFTGAATFTAGMQAAAVARTATADGLTTGIIAAGTSFVTVTSADAAHIIALPAAVVGNVIKGWVGSNGFEMRTAASSNATINGVDADGSQEAEIPASTHWEARCVATGAWLLQTWDASGALQTEITPD